MYYDWRKIDGYQCPLKIVIAKRGIGKTFWKVKDAAQRFITKGERFVYVVETGDMVKELSRNNGEKFWSEILKYYADCNTSKKRYFYNKLTHLTLEEDNQEELGELMYKRNINTKLTGSTIKIDGKTAGYILDMNSYGEIKRNNFSFVKTVIIDEFISEKFDKTTLQNPRKISSIIQSVARLKDVRIYMLGNSIRKEDSILSRMGFKLEKYGFYKKYDKHGLFAVIHFVDPEDYPEFAKAHDKSVAGRFSAMLGETNEEDNVFISDLPKDRILKDFSYKKNGFTLNVVKDDIIVSIKELKDGNFACVPFAGINTKNLYCLTEKEQGFKFGYHIICNLALRKTLTNMLRANVIYYYSEIEYTQLKLIIKGER